MFRIATMLLVVAVVCIPSFTKAQSTFGSIVGVVLLRLRRQGREIPIAFGPYLAAAGWLVLMFGPDVVTPYFSKYLGWP